jgi:hypothetical protein
VDLGCGEFGTDASRLISRVQVQTRVTSQRQGWERAGTRSSTVAQGMHSIKCDEGLHVPRDGQQHTSVGTSECGFSKRSTAAALSRSLLV